MLSFMIGIILHFNGFSIINNVHMRQRAPKVPQNTKPASPQREEAIKLSKVMSKDSKNLLLLALLLVTLLAFLGGTDEVGERSACAVTRG